MNNNESYQVINEINHESLNLKHLELDTSKYLHFVFYIVMHFVGSRNNSLLRP